MSKWYRAGTGFAIDGDNLAMRGSGWRTAYGAQEVKSGKAEWKIKITKSTNGIVIGVTSTTKYLESHYWSKKDTECYAYNSCNGYLYDKATNKAYSENSTTGNEIGVHLDMDNQCIWFSKNGKNLGNAYTDINVNVSYRLAVAMISKDSEVKIVSFKANSEEETKEDNINDNNYISSYTKYITKQCKYLENELSNDKIQGLDVKELSATSNYFSKLHQDINQLKIKLAKCESQLSQRENILKQKMSVDVNNYKKWNTQQIELYINGLENGRYSKYVSGLLSAFKNDGITGESLPDLDRADLRSFGVENFKDRKDLLQQFKALNKGNEGGNTC